MNTVAANSCSNTTAKTPRDVKTSDGLRAVIANFDGFIEILRRAPWSDIHCGHVVAVAILVGCSLRGRVSLIPLLAG